MVDGREVGVEPICTVLTEAGAKIAPSTYYAAASREPSARARRDEELKAEIARVHADNYGVYGVRKVHAQLVREGIAGHGVNPSGRGLVARCTTQRLMPQLGLRGLRRAKGPRPTVPGAGPDTRPDLVERTFRAEAPDRLWVADITFVPTLAGFLFLAVVLDAWSRRIVGWAFSADLKTRVVLDALDMALAARKPENVIHHSDQGSQYTSLAFGNEPNDGLVGECSTKMGNVIGTHYDMNHVDAINHLFGARSWRTNPVSLYRSHANRLKNRGL